MITCPQVGLLARLGGFSKATMKQLLPIALLALSIQLYAQTDSLTSGWSDQHLGYGRSNVFVTDSESIYQWHSSRRIDDIQQPPKLLELDVDGSTIDALDLPGSDYSAVPMRYLLDTSRQAIFYGVTSDHVNNSTERRRFRYLGFNTHTTETSFDLTWDSLLVNPSGDDWYFIFCEQCYQEQGDTLIIFENFIAIETPGLDWIAGFHGIDTHTGETIFDHKYSKLTHDSIGAPAGLRMSGIIGDSLYLGQYSFIFAFSLRDGGYRNTPQRVVPLPTFDQVDTTQIFAYWPGVWTFRPHYYQYGQHKFLLIDQYFYDPNNRVGLLADYTSMALLRIDPNTLRYTDSVQYHREINDNPPGATRIANHKTGFERTTLAGSQGHLYAAAHYQQDEARPRISVAKIDTATLDVVWSRYYDLPFQAIIGENIFAHPQGGVVVQGYEPGSGIAFENRTQWFYRIDADGNPVAVSSSLDALDDGSRATVSAYPNPSQNYVTLELAGDSAPETSSSAQWVFRGAGGASVTAVPYATGPQRVDVSRLAAGTYFACYEGGGERTCVPVVKN